MDFMLNLILTFTDNATAGLGNAANALANLQNAATGASKGATTSLAALSYSADMIGNSLVGMGSKVTGALSGLIGSVNAVGQTVYSAELGIGKLYSETDNTIDIMAAGSKKVDEIAEYAARTLFNFEDMIPIVQMLKANGIEAFDSIASSTGKADQMLMDYAADLAFFNPQMKNAYGTGIQAAMGALNEYIAEGNKRLLKSGASLDITSLLGEGVGDTIEERGRQVADLMEKLGLVGMTKAVGGDNPQIMLSNLGDQLFIFKSQIAKSGVREEFVNIIRGISDSISELAEDGKFNDIAQSLGEGITFLLKPVEKGSKALGKFIKVLGNLLAEHPNLSKFLVTFTAFLGGTTLGAGYLLKITSALSGFVNVLRFAGIEGGSFFGVMSSGIGGLIKSIGPLVLVLAGLYLAWKTDFMGIRTILTGLADDVGSAFSYASDALSQNVDYMRTKLNELDRDSFFGGIVTSIMKLTVIFRSLHDLWDDGKMDFDLYEKAVELGVDDLIGYIYDFKVRIDNFFKGFKEGWKSTMDDVTSFIESIGEVTKGTPLEKVFDFIKGGFTQFFKMLSSGSLKDWKSMGEVFGSIVSKILVVTVAMGGLLKVLRLFGKVGGKKKGGILSGLFGGGKEDEKIDKLTKGKGKFAEFANTLLKVAGAVMILGIAMKLFADSAEKVASTSGGTAALVVMFAGIAGLATVLSKVGKDLQESSIGIAAFAGSMVLLGIGMELFADSSAKLANAGPDAIAAMALMMVGVGALAFVFAGLGEKLDIAIPAMIAFGAALVLVGVGMELFADAALKLADGGNEALLALAALAGVIIVVGVAIGVLAAIGPMAAVVAVALGVAFLMIGKGVQWAAEGMASFVETLPTLSKHGEKAASNLKELAVAMAEFAAAMALEGLAGLIGSIGSALAGLSFGYLAKQATKLANAFSTIGDSAGKVSGWITSMKGSVKDMVSVVDTSTASVGDSFATMASKVESEMSRAVTAVVSGVAKLKAAMNFSWKLPNLKVPHITVSGAFNLDPPKAPNFNVAWYGKGGVFDNPQVIGVGERGKEAVVPLEQNTEWIDMMARKFVEYLPLYWNNYSEDESRYASQKITPVAVNNPQVPTAPAPIVNVPAPAAPVVQSSPGSVDNSVHFEAGAIVIQTNGTSDADARAFADKIMKTIARQQQLNSQANYGINYRAGV